MEMLIISSLLVILNVSFKHKNESNFDIGGTVWIIEKIEIKSIKHEFNISNDSCFKIKFEKVKNKKFDYRGFFSIFSEVKNSNSSYYVQPPYKGFYFLPDIKENKIKLGWVSHKSYNPNFMRSDLGKIIYEAFSINKGYFTFENNKLTISSSDGIALTLIKV